MLGKLFDVACALFVFAVATSAGSYYFVKVSDAGLCFSLMSDEETRQDLEVFEQFVAKHPPGHLLRVARQNEFYASFSSCLRTEGARRCWLRLNDPSRIRNDKDDGEQALARGAVLHACRSDDKA